MLCVHILIETTVIALFWTPVCFCTVLHAFLFFASKLKKKKNYFAFFNNCGVKIENIFIETELFGWKGGMQNKNKTTKIKN